MKDSEILLQDLLAHDAWIRALAHRLVKDEQAAEDVVQDTWVVALKNPPLRPGPVHAWIRRVVRNLVLMRSRSATRRNMRERAAAQQEGLPSVAEMREEEETRIRIAGAVFALDEPYRSAILYRYFKDLSPKEIATRLDVSISAVHERLRRGLQKLRARLDREFGDRKSWCAALLPVVVKATTGAGAATGTTSAPVLTGALVMSTKIKIGIAAAVVAATVLAAWSSRPRPATRTSTKKAAEAVTPSVAGVDPVETRGAPPVTQDAPAASDAKKPWQKGATDQAKRSASVWGTVRDDAGVPIAGARVCAMQYVQESMVYRPYRATTSGVDGAYRLGPVKAEPGSIRAGRQIESVLLEASAPGQTAVRREAHPGATTDFVLGKPGRLSGRITLIGTSDPVGEAVVKLFRERPNRNLSRRYQSAGADAETKSDAEGNYCFSRLAPGNYRIRILPLKQPLAQTEDVTIEVHRGGDVSRHFQVGRGITIRGLVKEKSTGEPIQGVRCWDWRNSRQVAVTDEEGRFELVGVEPEMLTSGGDLSWDAKGYRHVGVRNAWIAASSPSLTFLMEKETERTGGATVSGRVIGPDGQCVSGALVRTPTQQVKTDDRGKFRLESEGITYPSNMLVTTADGFARLSVRFKLREGEVKRDLLVRLEKGGEVSGRVMDDTEKPVAEADVTLSGPGSGRTITDADGHFAVGGLSPGIYDLLVNTKEERESLETEYIPVRRSGVHVAAGARTEVVVRLERGAVLQGQVVDHEGRPLEGVVVTAHGRMARTGVDGIFRIKGLPLQELKGLVAAKKGYLDRYLQEGLSAGTTGLEITMKKQLHIEGRVVHVGSRLPALEFWIEVRMVKRFGPRGWVGPRKYLRPKRFFVAPDGRFCTPVYDPGVYRVTAGTLDGMRSASTSVKLDWGDSQRALELSLDQGATLGGTVLTPTGNPATGGRVLVLAPLGNNRFSSEKGNLDENGRFRFVGLGPGSHLLRGYIPENEQWEAMQCVELGRGSEAEVVLRLESCGDLRIRVVDEKDTELPGAQIRISRTIGIHSFPIVPISDKYREEDQARPPTPNGRGLCLPPGVHSLEAIKAGYARHRHTIRIHSASNQTIKIVLKKE